MPTRLRGLIVAGRKRIEVRTWPTTQRGPLFIHASKTRDERPEAARIVTPEIAALCSLAGGVIGLVELIECREYRSRDAFAAEVGEHRNAPNWFVPPAMYGLRVAAPVPVPFFPCSGQTRFFYLAGVPLPPIIRPPETER